MRQSRRRSGPVRESAVVGISAMMLVRLGILSVPNVCGYADAIVAMVEALKFAEDFPQRLVVQLSPCQLMR